MLINSHNWHKGSKVKLSKKKKKFPTVASAKVFVKLNNYKTIESGTSYDFKIIMLNIRFKK